MITGLRQFKSRRPIVRMNSMPAPVKRTPGTSGPLFVLWSHTPSWGHRIWNHPRVLVRARCGFSDQYYRPAGAPPVPDEFKTQAVLGGAFNARNPATDLQDLTAEQRSQRNRTIARWIVYQYCEFAARQGLTRGQGFSDGGLAGGCIDFGEATDSYHGNATGDGTYSLARHCFGLMFDPRDACARTATVNTASGPRSITLPLRTLDARVPDGYSESTAAGAAQLDALTYTQQQNAVIGGGGGGVWGVRHTGYSTFWSRNGVAHNRELFAEIAQALEEMLPEFWIGGTRMEICEPNLILHSFEQQHHKLGSPLGDFKATGYPGGGQYRQIGNFWNVREDARFGTEAIYKAMPGARTVGAGVTMRDALLEDPLLAGLVTALAPTSAANVGLSSDQSYRMDGINYSAISHALGEAWQVLKDRYAGLRDGNYGLVRVADRTRPYTTVGGGLTHTQQVLRQDLQCPRCYGDVADTAAIKAAGTNAELEAAAAAWEARNAAPIDAMLDNLDRDLPVAAFVYGVTDPAKVRSGELPEYGGRESFFADRAAALYERGAQVIAIYGGDIDRTLAGVELACVREGWE
ncbi:MAG: hypothetical protein JSS51_03475 [Planctomycetes bacterium]|nr:hypothetical protein [Planctomycetota bacterium]